MAKNQTCVAGGQHRLLNIDSRYSPFVDGRIVVRWCEGCGSVVVDLDVDGRTRPGEMAPMRFPETAIAAAQAKSKP